MYRYVCHSMNPIARPAARWPRGNALMPERTCSHTRAEVNSPRQMIDDEKNCAAGGSCLNQLPIDTGNSSCITRYQMKNCTISGMLRKIATYTVPIPDAHLFGTVRTTPKSDPTSSAITHADSDTVIVTQRPENNQPR